MVKLKGIASKSFTTHIQTDAIHAAKSEKNSLKINKNSVLVNTGFDVNSINSDNVHDGYAQL